MKFRLKPDISYEALEALLNEKLQQYTVKKMKNPLAGFEYVEVKKSGTVGIWIRIMDKKDQLWLIKCMPSSMARAFLGLLFILFFVGAQTKLEKEVGEVLKDNLDLTVA